MRVEEGLVLGEEGEEGGVRVLEGGVGVLELREFARELGELLCGRGGGGGGGRVRVLELGRGAGVLEVVVEGVDGGGGAVCGGVRLE